MLLSDIEISKDEARAQLAQYEAQLHDERTAEDVAIAMGYRAAARGLPVISLARTITAGGFFPSGLPRLAVIRATETQCYVRWNGQDLLFASDRWDRNQGALVGKNTVRVTVPEDSYQRPRSTWPDGTTIVPLIPPRYRPRPRRLKHCHVLWEVEKWDRTPPRDPALLRHIRGDLWAVLATWDLTELERLVLGQRA